MALDPMFADPMLGPFRNMMKEVDDKGLTGPDVEEMRNQLGHMERLAQEMSDIAAYSGKLAQDMTFQKFSDAYGRALSGAAQAQAGGGSDGDLLAQTLSAYEDALGRYRQGQAGEEGAMLIEPLERVIALGRSGVSYPVFLQKLEEQGLSRVLEGAAPLVRSGSEKSLAFAEQSWDRMGIAVGRAKLAAFDELAARAPFGQPDALELELAHRRIDWDHDPLRARYDAMVRRWQYMIEMLVDWVDSFTQFAPYDERWRTAGSSEADVRQNIARTQETTPPRFHYREALYQRYFHQSWHQIWSDDTFAWEYTANRVPWSDERLQLCAEVYPWCRAGQPPEALLISRAEAMHPHGSYRPDRGTPPPPGTPLRLPPIQHPAYHG